MSTPGGHDAWPDPTAPSPSTPADSPVYRNPSFEKAEPYTPTSSGWYAAPDDAAVPSAPDQPDPGAAYPPPGTGDYPPPGTGDYPPPGTGEYPPPVTGDYPPPGGYPPPGALSEPGFAYPAPGTYPTYRPGPPTTSRGSSRGAVVALVVGLVVVLGLAALGVGFLLTSGNDDDRRTAAPLTTSRSATPPRSSGSSSGTTSGTSTGSAPTSSAPTGAAEVMVPAVTPGFQGVLSQKENVAYDVPQGWEPQTPGTLVGYEDANGNPIALIHGVSTYLPDACPGVNGSNRGNAGFKTAGTVDPAQAVQDGVTVFAQAAALNDDGSSAPVTPGTLTDVAVAGGSITAKMFTATVTPTAGGDCSAPSIAFTGVAFATPSGGTALFIMFLDQGTSDALPPATAQQIVASLRPYTG